MAPAFAVTTVAGFLVARSGLNPSGTSDAAPSAAASSSYPIANAINKETINPMIPENDPHPGPAPIKREIILTQGDKRVKPPPTEPRGSDAPFLENDLPHNKTPNFVQKVRDALHRKEWFAGRIEKSAPLEPEGDAFSQAAALAKSIVAVQDRNEKGGYTTTTYYDRRALEEDGVAEQVKPAADAGSPDKLKFHDNLSAFEVAIPADN